MNTNKQSTGRDPNFGNAQMGEMVRSGDGARGVYVGCSPSGVSFVRWLRNGELRTSRNVRNDVATMAARLASFSEAKQPSLIEETDHDPIKCRHCGHLSADVEDMQWHYDSKHAPKEE